MRTWNAGQPNFERYIISTRVEKGTIAKPTMEHERGVSGPAGDAR